MRCRASRVIRGVFTRGRPDSRCSSSLHGTGGFPAHSAARASRSIRRRPCRERATPFDRLRRPSRRRRRRRATKRVLSLSKDCDLALRQAQGAKRRARSRSASAASADGGLVVITRLGPPLAVLDHHQPGAAVDPDHLEPGDPPGPGRVPPQLVDRPRSRPGDDRHRRGSVSGRTQRGSRGHHTASVTATGRPSASTTAAGRGAAKTRAGAGGGMLPGHGRPAAQIAGRSPHGLSS